MRQLFIQVPADRSGEVAHLVEEHDGINAWRLPTLAGFDAATSGAGAHAGRQRGDHDLFIVHLQNQQVGSLLTAVSDLEADAHITLNPRGMLPLRPPAGEAPDQVEDVGERSPIEVFLAGIQSIGALQGLVGYAVAAGVVVWIGLYTNTVYLLTASMLIAPFAGPAMNTAIATATGRTSMLRGSLGRYALGLGLTSGTTALLTLLLGPERLTELMVAVTTLSSVTALLPLTAGVAGALHLVQSERDSLVSGAAVGILVAASLAPPTGVVGMALVLGEWGALKAAAFVLVLQLVGIHVSGTLVFRWKGLTAHGTRFMKGRKHLFPIALAVSSLALVGLLAWQFSSTPELQRSTRAQQASQVAQEAIRQSGLAAPVEVNARYTRSGGDGQETLLATAYVQPAGAPALPADSLQQRLTRAIQARLAARFDGTPLVGVTVLSPPPSPADR